MMNISDSTVKEMVVDYPLHLIEPMGISDKDLEKFSSSLREVIGCIKYSYDKNKLAAFIHDNPRMNMEIEAARVIETITSVSIDNKEVDSMGNVNLCKAIEDMIQDVVDEKKDDWLAEGRLTGLSEGRLAGLSEGKMQLLSTLIQSGDISLQKAASIMNMTPEEFLSKSKTIS